MSTEATTLSACPFCNSLNLCPPHLQEDIEGNLFTSCYDCGARGPSIIGPYNQKRGLEAEEAWSRRTASVDLSEIEELMNSELRARVAKSPASVGADAAAFQARVDPWLLACFGEQIARDKEERNHRFLEEALELVQACGCSQSEAHQLVDYTFNRPPGEASQEVGGVMVTLAALCLANGLDMHEAGETELARIWTKVETIRAKQAAKPRHSPLPAASPSSAAEIVAEKKD